MASEDEAALYCSTFSDSPVGISVATPEGRVLAVNRALCRLLGYSAAELLAISFDDIVHPDDLPDSREGLRALLSGTDASWAAQRRSLRKDGETVWTRVTAVLERDADGAPLYLRTYFEDIHHELEAKQALRESEERLRRALDAAQVGVYRCHVDDGAIVTANQQLADLLECSLDELLAGHTAIDWVEPDAYAGMVATLRDGGEVRNREMGVRTTTGEHRTVLLSLRLGADESHLEGMVVNISDRRRTEEALFNANQMFQVVMDAIPQRVFWKDSQIRYLGCNQSFASDAGFAKPADLVGKDDNEMPWRETADHWGTDDDLVMRTDSAKVNYEEPQTLPDGSQLWLRVSRIPLHDQAGAVIGVLGSYEDITERKQIEEERSRLLAIIEESPDYIGTFDLQGHLGYHNRAAKRVVGLPEDADLAGMTIADMYPERVVRLLLEKGLPAALRDGSWRAEFALLHRDGHEILVSSVLMVHRDQDGRPTSASTIARDMTERTTMEAALHKRVMELTCLFELSRLIERPGIDLDGILRGAAELLPSAFLHADVAGARIAIEGATFASPGFVASRWRLSVPLGVFGEPTGFLEVCYREERPQADNGPFLAEELALLKTVTQRLEHVVERYRALGRLQISEERFALAARGANDGIWDWDLMTDEMMLSPRWKSILGYDEDELTESVTTWLALLHPDDTDPVRESMSRYLAGEADSFERESRLRHKDGHYVPVLTRGFALRRESDGAALRFVGTNTDLTELKAVETSLRGAVAELRRSNQDLELFAYVASHDLQEPLRMVASYTQLLARRYAGELDQDAQDFIGYAVDGATRMQRLIQDLLTYSRVTTRGAPSAPVDVRGALDEALRNLETAIAESGAVVTADDLPTVLGDRTQIVQLLQNLIGNGIKFRRPGVSPHVHLSARPDPDNDNLWVFQVADDGIGIDPKYADRVFAIFQRLQSRQEYPGTGIGLALCKRIVERHGGAIWLQPDLTDGTTINFTLPSATRQ